MGAIKDVLYDLIAIDDELTLAMRPVEACPQCKAGKSGDVHSVVHLRRAKITAFELIEKMGGRPEGEGNEG